MLASCCTVQTPLGSSPHLGSAISLFPASISESIETTDPIADPAWIRPLEFESRKVSTLKTNRHAYGSCKVKLGNFVTGHIKQAGATLRAEW
jgi:hypothetical protein